MKIQVINTIVFSVTLVILLFYAYDTRRIANQTEENATRPVVLRSGYIASWDDIHFTVEETDSGQRITSGEALQFIVLKNIAQNITGEIVLNGKKYPLLFGGQKLSPVGSASFAYLPELGWVKPDATLFAAFDPSTGEDVNSANQIRITYADVVGNRYETIEDKDFRSISRKE